MLKQGINVILPVGFRGIDMSSVSKIEFVFKQEKTPHASCLKVSEYNSDGSGDVMLREGTNILEVPWTSDETYLFIPNSTVYMDTRITVNDSEYNPITTIAEFPMKMSLFEEQHDGD